MLYLKLYENLFSNIILINMNSLVKITSNEGGSFTKTNNLVSFNFGNGVYDLSKSYVELMTRIVSTGADGTAHGGAGVYISNVEI